MTRKSLPTAVLNSLSLQRYLADRADGDKPPKQAAAAQPIKPRFDGAASRMPTPRELRGSKDQFQALRRKASSATGRYGKK